MIVTINVAVLLAIVIVLRLRRRTQARSRNDEMLTVAIVLMFGVLVAGTDFGDAILRIVGTLVKTIEGIEVS